MIDPKNVTNFNLNQLQLEELLFFWVCVAGKNATTIAPRIDAVLKHGYHDLRQEGPLQPFKVVRLLSKEYLASLLKHHGIGCYNQKASTMKDLAEAWLDLKTCERDDLTKIKGIGLKTASCFIMHTREKARCAGIDTHMSKLLGVLYPKECDGTIPKSKKQYLQLENRFLEICDKLQYPPAKFDLLTWRIYAHHKHHASKFVKIIESRMQNDHL